MPSTVSPPGVWRGRSSPYRVLLLALAALLSAASLPGLSQSFGQDDEPSRKPPSSNEKKKFQGIIKAGKLADKDDEACFDGYVQYYIDNVVEPESLDAKLPQARTELKKLFLRDLCKPPAKELHDRANQMVLDACLKAIEDAEKAWAVRLNCAIMIGELDSPEAYVGGPPAVPWSAANAELLKIVADAKQHLAVRIGALIGLDHELTIGLPADVQTKLADSLAAVLKSPAEDVQEGQRVGQFWLRFRAADLLESLAEKGVAVDKGAIATTLASLAADEKIEVWMRCHAAAGLGRVEARDLSALDVAPTVHMLAGLAMASLSASPFTKWAETADEADDAAGDKKKRDDKKNKDDKKNEEQEDEPKDREPMTKNMREKSANALWTQLDQVRVALSGVPSPSSRSQPQTSDAVGLYAAADDATKQAITEMLKQIDGTIKHLRAPNDLSAIAKSVVDAADGFHQVLVEGAEAATAEAATAEAAKPAPRRGGGPPQGNNPANSPARP